MDGRNLRIDIRLRYSMLLARACFLLEIGVELWREIRLAMGVVQVGGRRERSAVGAIAAGLFPGGLWGASRPKFSRLGAIDARM